MNQRSSSGNADGDGGGRWRRRAAWRTSRRAVRAVRATRTAAEGVAVVCLAVSMNCVSLDDRSVYVLEDGGATADPSSGSDGSAAGSSARASAGSGGLGNAGGTDEDAAASNGGTSNAGAGSRDDAGSDELESPPPLLACAQSQHLETGTPLATSTTVDEADDFSGSCASGTAPDVAFDWIAPASDYYSLDTFGSSFDTALYLLDGSCGGAELACSSNAAGGVQSEILEHFEAGQRLVIVVDGEAADQGTVQLNTQRIACPTVDITDQPLPLRSSTATGSNDHDGTCGGEGHPERAFRWIPAESGLYSVSVAAETFKPALYVEQGPRCGGALLGCNAGAGAERSYPAEVIRRLEAGQPVTLIIDGADGNGFFDLNITRLDELTCPALEELQVGSPTILAGALAVNSIQHSTASCADAGGLDFISGPYAYGDHAYRFDQNHGPTTRCTYTVSSDNGPFAVYRVAGACAGPELACLRSTVSGATHSVSFSVGSADNGPQTLIIENLSSFDISYEIAVACIA